MTTSPDESPSPSSSSTGEWISLSATMAILRRTERHVRRLAADGKLRSTRRGRNVFYNRDDVNKLAEEINSSDGPPPRDVVEIVPSTDLARRIDELTNALLAAEARASAAETALKLLPPPADVRRIETEAIQLRNEANTLRNEANALQRQLEQAQATINTGRQLGIALVGIIVLLIIGLVLIAVL